MNQATLAADELKNATPAPAKVIWRWTRARTHGWVTGFGRPLQHRMRCGRRLDECAAYALSQQMRKSSAAAPRAAPGDLLGESHTRRIGVGGHHPQTLIDGSFAVSSAIAATSGPSGFIGTVIISIPNDSVIAKCCRSPVPGTGT